VFGAYEKHRAALVDEVFVAMRKLPAGKRHLRTFTLHHLSRALGAAVGAEEGQVSSLPPPTPPQCKPCLVFGVMPPLLRDGVRCNGSRACTN
jgi:hypothetical protein